MSDSVTKLAGRIAHPIRKAIAGLSGERNQAIMVLLIDEGPMSFTEIQKSLGDIHQQKLTNTLYDLQKGGLVNHITDTHPSTTYSSYYEVSVYGRKFMESLYDSLGFRHRDARAERIGELMEVDGISGARLQRPDVRKSKSRPRATYENSTIQNFDGGATITSD